MSKNINAIHLLEKNQDKINWDDLSSNINAIPLLSKNLDRINWENLSSNPNAIHILEKNQDKIDWKQLSKNPAIFELDYEALQKRCSIYAEELVQKAMHPSRIQRYLDDGYSIDDINNFL